MRAGLPAATAAPSSAEERLARREAVLHQRRVQRWRLVHPAAGHPAGSGRARGR